MQTRAVPVREISCERRGGCRGCRPIAGHAVHIGENTGPARLHLTHPCRPLTGAWNWDNYAEVLGAKLLPVAVKNTTAVILVVSIFFNVLLGSVTAYCLRPALSSASAMVMGCFYLGMLVPTFVVEIARFKVIQSMGLHNTLGAPIIIYVASDLMRLYLYMQFVSKIPKALDESALIDGCGYFRIFSIIFRFWPRQRPRSSF